MSATSSSHPTPNLRDERGQSLVEFTLVLPLLLLVLFGIVEFARVLNYTNDMNQIAANGARLAAVDRIPSGTSLQAYLKGTADTAVLRGEATSESVSAAEVCITFPGDAAAVGDPVKVEAKTQFDLLPIIDTTATSITLRGTATMRLEQPPSTYSAGCD